ncbi:kinase-like protein [Fistulina hepatica ATCC 64428]|uniref:cAMP-dependent protein kinase n=1 Tax=Fistulina hepatica ATCC 64428 TaxID=1128425 RepID=A0A0D7A1X8_9AGAR|nr:kinase-like protein [Fistulina hepatica ATCC 64428]
MKSRDNIPYRFPSTAQIISPLSLPRPSISTISTSLLSYTSDYLQPPEPPQSFFSFTVPRLSNTDALQPPSQLQGFRVSDFAIVRTLGQGSFGRVHLVQSRYNSHYYAMKVLRKSYITKKDQVAHTNSERFMLSSLNHSFIIRLWASFQDAEYLYMILDFAAGGDLFQLLRRSGKFPEKVVKFYSAEVALALNFMHSCNVIYRDLKLENILIGGDGHIKVADFGFAKVADERAWTLCGTPDYIAPEVIRGERYNQSIDWYALGVLIYEMMVGTPPFWAPDVNALYERIMYGTSIVAWPENVFDVVDLILQLMHNDPTRRLGNLLHGAGDLFQHPFYAEVDWARLLAKEITPPYQPDLTHPGDASA